MSRFRFLLLLLALLMGACVSTPPAPPRTTLTIGLIGEPPSVFADSDRDAAFVGALITEDLVRLDDKGDLVARLVEKVPTLDNGLARVAADEAAPAGRLEVTFTLRSGLVWQDGQPITSDDVLYAWQRDRAARVGTRARADADLIERVDVVDGRTAMLVLRPGVRTSRYAALAHVMPRHILAGASAGALAGALFTIGMPAEAMLDLPAIARDVASACVRAYRPSAQAILSAAPFIRYLRDRMGEDVRIENLPRPLIIATTDLDTREPRPGEYCAGWIKRGPSGVIGTNKPDAAETVTAMIEDLEAGRLLAPAEPEPEAVETLVRQRQPQWFSYADWRRLDELEVARGRSLGRPRVKFIRVEEMLAALGRT